MALIDLLTESPALGINRFPDIDHFRHIEHLAEARSIPLDLRDFASAYATVTLISCSIFLQRTFPRILQAQYRTHGAMLAFAMNDTDCATMNGVEVRSPTLLLVNGSTPCDAVELQANLVAVINFHVPVDRGWPLVEDRAQPIWVDLAAIRTLRAVTRDILMLASNEPDHFPSAVEAMEESLLEAIDRVFCADDWVLGAWRSTLSSHLALVRKLDDLLVQNAPNTSYSADVARQLGVSVRTVHNAVVAIRGMSLHRYSRLLRLWNVRRQLVAGSADTRIKPLAFANGFWHMGEFARHYRAAFGETPQQTLQRRY